MDDGNTSIQKAKPIGLGALIVLALSGLANGGAGFRPTPTNAGLPALADVEVQRLRIEIEGLRGAVKRMSDGLSARLDKIDEAQAEENRRLRERIGALERRRD